jgi:hypothetical protein
MIEGQKLIQDQVCRALLECYLFKNRWIKLII